MTKTQTWTTTCIITTVVTIKTSKLPFSWGVISLLPPLEILSERVVVKEPVALVLDLVTTKIHSSNRPWSGKLLSYVSLKRMSTSSSVSLNKKTTCAASSKTVLRSCFRSRRKGRELLISTSCRGSRTSQKFRLRPSRKRLYLQRTKTISLAEKSLIKSSSYLIYKTGWLCPNLTANTWKSN